MVRAVPILTLFHSEVASSILLSSPMIRSTAARNLSRSWDISRYLIVGISECIQSAYILGSLLFVCNICIGGCCRICLISTAIILVLTLLIVLHCFLWGFSIYCGLLVSCWFVMSSQCLILDISCASFWISFGNSCWFVRSTVTSVSFLQMILFFANFFTIGDSDGSGNHP